MVRPRIDDSTAFRFGVRRLLILTTTVAMIMAITSRLVMPSLFRAVVASYFAIFAFFVIMRGPTVYRRLSAWRGRLRKLKTQRLDLQREVSKLKQIDDESERQDGLERGTRK